MRRKPATSPLQRISFIGKGGHSHSSLRAALTSANTPQPNTNNPQPNHPQTHLVSQCLPPARKGLSPEPAASPSRSRSAVSRHHPPKHRNPAHNPRRSKAQAKHQLAPNRTPPTTSQQPPTSPPAGTNQTPLTPGQQPTNTDTGPERSQPPTTTQHKPTTSSR